MTQVTVNTLDGEARFDAYIARPDQTPRAAIIVIQEIFGVNEGIRRKCDKLATEGYLAIAPDLFWRLEPGIELDPDVPDQLQQAFGLMKRFDQDLGIQDLEATIRAARQQLAEAGVPDGKVGAVGYCLGGRLAYMTAARTDVNASVGYYAVGIDGLLGEQHAIAHPLLLHIAKDDHFVDADAQRRMHEGLDDHPKVTLIDYPGVDHGFATEMGDRRNDIAAEQADRNTADFFAKHLG